MNVLASIQKIHSIQPHPNPEVERLEVAKVLAWPVVVSKGQFKDGDLVIFITIDSIVPDRPEFEFMRKQKFKVWNAKFKGAPSSGLVQPLSIIPPSTVFQSSDLKEGDDVTEILGVIKYERPLDPTLRGNAKGGFPTDLISITDEDNLLSHPKALDELQEGQELYITLKNDGSSVTIVKNNDDFKGCSRRLEMKEGEGFPWTIIQKYDLKNKLIALGKNVAIQGEAIGPKLNGNRLKLKEIEFRLFRVKNLDTMEIYGYNELKDFAKTVGVPMVEEVMVIKFDKNVHTIEWFRALADSMKWPNTGETAEGIVIAPVVPMHSYELSGRWSIKVINQNYKQE